jgi:hypothetical protein
MVSRITSALRNVPSSTAPAICQPGNRSSSGVSICGVRLIGGGATSDAPAPLWGGDGFTAFKRSNPDGQILRRCAVDQEQRSVTLPGRRDEQQATLPVVVGAVDDRLEWRQTIRLAGYRFGADRIAFRAAYQDEMPPVAFFQTIGSDQSWRRNAVGVRPST